MGNAVPHFWDDPFETPLLGELRTRPGGCAPGTAYFIPARAGAWLVGGSFPGSDGRLGFVAAPPRRRAAPLARGGLYFSRFVPEDGGRPDAFY